MGFHLLAGIDQRLVQQQRQAGGGGQGAVGNAGDAIKGQLLELSGIGVENAVEEVGIGDDLAEVDVVIEHRTGGLHILAE